MNASCAIPVLFGLLAIPILCPPMTDLAEENSVTVITSEEIQRYGYLSLGDKGTGPGLAMVYGIVKQSRGYVWVYTEPGLGTTFKVYLPRYAETAAARMPERTVVSAPPSGSETILLVEDEDTVRALTSYILTEQGYNILEATSGPDALLIVEKHAGPIHLMLSDVIMPRMNGPTLARIVPPLRPSMKVLFMSGYPDDALGRHAAGEGPRAFLPKPFTLDALTHAMREALDSQGLPGSVQERTGVL